MRKILCLFPLILPGIMAGAQRPDVPRIESSDCIYKADDFHKTHCGNLVVPESRLHPQSGVIKLPFIYVESSNPAKKPDPVLYTGGGPGVSSLHPVTSIAGRSLLKDRDYIAFEQRGTHYASPNLECQGSGQAVQEAYLGIATFRIVSDMIGGQQERYIKEYFDGVFSANGAISGMRLSVYCSDKMAFEDPAIIQQQDDTMPWLAGFHVNDVYGKLCESWPVKPIDVTTKRPFYSNVPALLGAGGLDDACRPLYNDMIHHYLPNSQRLLFAKRQHAPLLNSNEGDVYIGEFLNNPSEQLAGQEDIKAY